MGRGFCALFSEDAKLRPILRACVIKWADLFAAVLLSESGMQRVKKAEGYGMLASTRTRRSLDCDYDDNLTVTLFQLLYW